MQWQLAHKLAAEGRLPESWREPVHTRPFDGKHEVWQKMGVRCGDWTDEMGQPLRRTEWVLVAVFPASGRDAAIRFSNACASERAPADAGSGDGLSLKEPWTSALCA